MNTVKTLDEATAHFQESVVAIIVTKGEGEGEGDDAAAKEVTSLEEAREFYGFTAPAEPKPVEQVTEENEVEDLGNDASTEQTGIAAQEANDNPVL